MVKALRFAPFVALTALAASASACLNDRDTLAQELRDDDSGNRAIKAIVGWFPVHSELYYRVRIQRSARAIKEHPESLGLYDDVAVAYERLGDDAKAISTMEQKRAYMVAHHIAPKPNKANADKASKDQIVSSSEEPWYRYYANTGTFWVHRWFRSGMPKEHKAEWLGEAQKDIDQAIELNPLAHGLREFAQDEMIRWMRTGEPGQTFFDFEPEEFWKDGHTIDALAGLVELGGAWESPDVYQAMVQAFDANGEPSAAYFASLRVQELQKAGKRSLTGRTFPIYDGSKNEAAEGETVYLPKDPAYKWVKDKVPPFVEQDFVDLRKAADSYRQDLISYEVPLLEQGGHPDSDPQFWFNYKEPPFPKYGENPYWKEGMDKANLLFKWVLVGLVTVPILIVTLIVWRRRRKRFVVF